MNAAATAGERALARALGRFAHDPLGFVRFAFAWNQGALAGEAGPDRWQVGFAFALTIDQLRAA